MRLPLRKWLVAYVRQPLTLALAAVLAIYGLWQGATSVARWIDKPCDAEVTQDNGAETSPATQPHLPYHFTRHAKRNINYGRVFNDRNDTQLIAARRFGIQPVENRAAAERMGKHLVMIRDCRYYKVDPLTHSIPYLVPDAADFLLELGKLFQEYSGTESRFIITSALRTKSDVHRLRRSGNANATENSCHFYATTIDIAYNRFDRHGRTWDGRLKENLAQALYDLRAAGYCYVKYEYRQACFHVTVRR